MSVLTFSHPKLKNIEFELGQLNQVVGNNNEIKQQLWQVLKWYLSKHKYSEAELTLLDYKEPEIWIDKELLSRNSFQTIVVESMSDIHELLSVKKGTPVYSVLQEITTSVEISENMEIINQQLNEIEMKLNTSAIFKEVNTYSPVLWRATIASLTSTDLLQKKVNLEVIRNNKRSAIEYESGLTKYQLLINFLRSKLMNNIEPVLFMIKNIDDSLYYNDFIEIMKQFEQLTIEYPHFYCMIFPSQIGYVYISEAHIPNVLVIGKQTHMLEEGKELYNSVCNHYPDHNVPLYETFLSQLQIITPYLFSDIQQATYLSVKDQIIIKIINELHYFYDFQATTIEECSKSEYRFLFDK